MPCLDTHCVVVPDRYLTPKESGDLSVLFDVGGVAGGIMAGHLSDKSGASAVVATSFTLLSVPFLWMYRHYGHFSLGTNIALMMVSGFFVNGPYALITTAVSADLGTHESLQVRGGSQLSTLWGAYVPVMRRACLKQFLMVIESVLYCTTTI